MRRVFREWLNARFDEWLRELNVAFEDAPPFAGPGMVKGRTYRRHLGKAWGFVVLRYQADRPKVFLSFAWNNRKTPPSDEIYLKTAEKLRTAQDRGSVFDAEAGWLEARDWSAGGNNWFEAEHPALSDADVARFAKNEVLRRYWHTLGVPDDLLKANAFLRNSVLTWDSVGDFAPELISDDDCAHFFGAMHNELREALVTCILPAIEVWDDRKTIRGV